jgi:hypothetical protein
MNTSSDDDYYLECTCGSTGVYAEDHDEMCELGMSLGFTEGTLIWSQIQHRLREAVSPRSTEEAKWWDFTPAPRKPYVPCAHGSQAEFEFSNGTKIYLSTSSSTSKPPRVQRPDIHIMLASAQRPIGVAWYVDWPDYSLPSLSDQDMWQFVGQVTDMLLDGRFIEAGCMAAHGRTGTFVGLLELAARQRAGMLLPESDEIVRFVRDNHCKKAVEGDEQQWYLDHYRAHLIGEESPPKPGKQNKWGPKKDPNQLELGGN